MEPAANVLPKIEASHYDDFRKMIANLPASYEAWRSQLGTATNFRAIRPEQFREFLNRHHRQDGPTSADLYRCAEYLWNRDIWRSDW